MVTLNAYGAFTNNLIGTVTVNDYGRILSVTGRISEIWIGFNIKSLEARFERVEPAFDPKVWLFAGVPERSVEDRIKDAVANREKEILDDIREYLLDWEELMSSSNSADAFDVIQETLDRLDRIYGRPAS